MVSSKEDGVQNDEIINLAADCESTRVGDIGLSSIETPKKGISKLQVPRLGMEFKTVDDAKNFYREYGRQEGFCTRTRTTDRKQHGSVMITSCLFVCSREGIHNKKEITLGGISGKPRNTSTVRCQCQASMRVIKRKFEDIYEVTMVENTHNHGLVSPCKRMNMRVNKCMPEAAKKLTMVFHDEGLPIAKVASVFCGDTIGFTAKDCHNHFGATRKKPKEGDATAVLHYFEKMSAEDPQFYYAIESDPKGRAVNFFWVDGRSRMQYENFGDVVSFDTTYRTNAYEMPFAPFTGVNHHLMSIQFGCGLLLDETEETFVWLFKTWLAAMGGRPPTSMITDQDKAMTAAVAKVFPNTRHRHCLWHITNKFPEKLAHVMHTNEKFTEELKLIISGSYRIDDFEKKWNEHMLKYKLQDHDWLKGIYDARRKWVPAYHLDTFFAGMNTTGRSESMNSYYDMVLKPSTTLTEFVYSIDKLLALIVKNERDFDYRTEHSSCVVSKNDFLLKHAGKVYTVNVFGKFKSQWDKAKGVYKIDKEEVGENGFNIYTLKSRNTSNPCFWKVNFNTTTLQGDCECKYPSFMGIPCGHLLKVFLRHDIDEIPDHFILKRWTQKSNTYRAMFEGGLVDGHETSESLRVAHSCRLATQLAFDASTDDDTYRFLVEKFNELSVEIAKRRETLNKSVSSEVLASNEDCEEPSLVDPSQVLLLNPNISLTKGRPKEDKANSTRIKRGIEISQEKKGRLCSSCKKVVKHDSRTCPMNPNRKKKAKCMDDDQCSENGLMDV